MGKKLNLFSNSQNLKKILRDPVSDIIPENLLNAPKRGFGFGITEKKLLQGSWKNHAERVLNNFQNIQNRSRKGEKYLGLSKK